jgi:hypothetical protein
VRWSARDAAAAVHDPRHNIYGNWSRAIHAAGLAKVSSSLRRFSDWSTVRDHLRDVGPLAISMRFTSDELPEAGYDASEGHIVVLYGLDAAGDAMVLDPAYSTEADAARTYPRDRLSALWMDRAKGIAYATYPSAIDNGEENE